MVGAILINRKDSHPKLVLDVKAGDAINTLRRYEKLYYLHNEAFWGDLGRPLRLFWKWFERAGEGEWFGVFMVHQGMGSCMQREGHMVWILCQCQRREHLGFLSSLTRCGRRGRGKVWLKATSSLTSKNGVRLFTTNGLKIIHANIYEKCLAYICICVSIVLIKTDV